MSTPLGQEDTFSSYNFRTPMQHTSLLPCFIGRKLTHRVPTTGFNSWDVTGSRVGTLTSSNKVVETWAGAGAVWPPVRDAGNWRGWGGGTRGRNTDVKYILGGGAKQEEC